MPRDTARRHRERLAAMAEPVEDTYWPKARTAHGIHFVPTVQLGHRCRRDLLLCQAGYRPDRTDTWTSYPAPEGA